MRIDRIHVTLFVLLIGGAVLRFWGLGSNSLWVDELASWVQSNHPSLTEVVSKGVKPDVHPPGYQALLFYIIKYIGDEEWLLRFPSAFAGVLSILAIYLLGRRLYGPREGLIAAAVMTVSWAPIYYSQEARSNSILLLLSIAVFYFWVQLLRQVDTSEKVPVTTTIGYTFFSVAACYLHYFGLQLVILQMAGAAALFAAKPKALLRIGAIYGLICLAYLPWLPSMLYQMRQHPTTWIPEPTLLGATGGFIEFAYRVEFWVLITLILPAYLYASLKCLLAVSTERGARSIRELSLSSGGLLLLWAVVPFLAAYIQSRILTPVLTDRNLITLLPPVYLLLARGIASLQVRWARLLWVSVLCLALLLSLIFDHHYYARPQKTPLREAAMYIVQHRQGANELPIIAFTWHKEFLDYYLIRLGRPERVALVAGRNEDVSTLEVFLASQGADGFWYLSGQRQPEQEFLAFLNTRFRVAASAEFKETSVTLYRRSETQ